MVELPPGALRPVFDAQLVRGAVVRLEQYPLRSGARDKFFVLLNIDCTAGSIFHALTTSRVERYSGLAFAGHGVLIPQGAVPCFDLPTIVDCHSLLPPLARENLFTGFCARRVQIHPALPGEYMEKVDRILRENRLIANAVKQVILPPIGNRGA